MKRLYIITGANGHLGGTIIRLLKKTGANIRGLILTGEKIPEEEKKGAKNINIAGVMLKIPAFGHIEYVEGDVRDKESLRLLFADTESFETIVIHTAGIVDITSGVTPLMYDVNVTGTKNIISLCKEYKVKRLVYVSSVHAIPEKDNYSVMSEVKKFSPDLVMGGYAKTKAEATQAVLDAAAGKINGTENPANFEEGLDAVVVHPSGIIGPYDDVKNHLVQLVADYMDGKLPACVRGGYDFVDVRDVASGCLRAVEKGRKGECYILSNRHYEIKEVLKIARNINGGRKLPVLPVWMAKTAVPLMTWMAKRRKKRPLYTKYSLQAISSNDRFDHDKATAELNYRPRDLYYTINDTIAWLKKRKPLAGKS